MVISAVGYGIFFGSLSQLFIYRGDISFMGLESQFHRSMLLLAGCFRLRSSFAAYNESFFDLVNTDQYYFSTCYICDGWIQYFFKSICI